MPTLYEDETYVVSQAWFGGWKVKCKFTGQMLKPNTDQVVRIGIVWRKLRSKRYKAMSPPANLAEDHMFFRFAQSVEHPKSRAAIYFLGADIDDLAEMFVREANSEYLREGLTRKRK